MPRQFGVLLCGILLGIGLTTLSEADAREKSFDERKVERLAKHRTERRAEEQKYLACIKTCVEN